MKRITRSRYFWAAFAFISGATILISYYYFPRAFPIIHLNLTMNRSEAVQKAREIATSLHLGPQHALHATSFVTDEEVKTFVELAAGGKEKVGTIIKENLYQIYTWHIRLFKPFEQREATIQFTPEGHPYGFEETLSENDPGSNVSESKAQEIATSFAQAAPWHIDFTQYKLVDASQEKKTGGRIDHTLTYERTKEKIGEGFYHLKLVVSGDKVSELVHSVKVPDAFTRRYQQMRSANETIAHISQLIMYLLYLFGCLGIGLLFLFNIGWVVWRPALFWALFIASLEGATLLNKLPLHWMEYNTALSPYAFIAQFLVAVLLNFILSTLLFTAVFIGAESLGRRAFSDQLQLWQTLQSSVISSYTILGYTCCAYLIVPIELAYTVTFYMVTAYLFNWCTPSSALFDPNILASYMPWLESVAVSLQAGFYEECLYRAVPLASAALLGNRYGKRNWWIAGAMILQAIVFGAAHANYPAQPAYVRLVELLAFSSVFGAIYLKFGLLITIVSHFAYDVFWFALPLFISSAPYAWLSKIFVIALTAIPFGVIGIARIKAGAWTQIPAVLYNQAWRPHKKETPLYQQPPQQGQSKYVLSTRTLCGFVIAGILGLTGWVLTTKFKADTPSFTTNRSFIFRTTQQTLQQKGIEIAQWYPMVYPTSHLDQYHDVMKRHRFIWQQGGKDLYHQFVQSYLSPQLWIARFVKWDGTVVERSEEHHFYVMPDGTWRRYTHKVPEAAPGASLTKEAAQKKALELIAQQFHTTQDKLKEIAAVATKEPNRVDWEITYATTIDHGLDSGQARFEVHLAGDEVVDAYRYIHVPEKWERTYDNQQAVENIIHLLCFLIILLLLLGFTYVAYTKWPMKATPALFIHFSLLSVIFLFDLFNSWPEQISTFNTSQPFASQLFRTFSISTIIMLLLAGLVAVIISMITQIHTIYRAAPSSAALPIGISVGTIIAGSFAIAQWLMPSLSPTWADFSPVAMVIPVISGITNPLTKYLYLTIHLMLFTIACNAITNCWQRLKLAGISIFFMAGFVWAGLIYAYNIPLMIVISLLLLLILLCTYLLVMRFDYSIAPIATGTYTILQAVQQLTFNAYPYARLANSIAILLIAGTSLYWYMQMRRCHENVT